MVVLRHASFMRTIRRAIAGSFPRISRHRTLQISEMKKVLRIALPVLVGLIFVGEKFEASFSFTLNHSDDEEVFLYLSKAENLPLLNPTILSLTLANRTEDEFYVIYEEHLSQLPIIKHFGGARYWVKHGKFGGHELLSVHSTCFLGESLCLSTASSVVVNKTTDSRVSYRENIRYTCPRILNHFCLMEVLFQRMAIMEGLADLFEKRPFQLVKQRT